MEKSGRNWQIDFWKFVAAIYVVLQHSHFLFGRHVLLTFGYFANEFFFMVTGFLFATSVFGDDRPFSMAAIGGETCAFVWRKIQRFLRLFVWCFMITFALRIYQIGGDHLLHTLIGSLADLFLLRSTGLPTANIMGVDWYLSSMIIVLFLLYPVFRWNRVFFRDWMAIALAVGCLGYMYSHYGNITPGGAGKDFTDNNIRAVGAICLGVVAYGCSWRLRNASRAALRAALFPAAAFAAAAIGFTIMTCMEHKADGVMVLICFFVSLVLGTVGRNETFPPVLSRICEHLGKLSLGLFLGHTAVRRALEIIAERSAWLNDHCTSQTPESLLIVTSIYLVAALALAEISLFVCGLKWRRTGS